MERGQSGRMGRQGQKTERIKQKLAKKKPATTLFNRCLKQQEKGKRDKTGSRCKVKSKRSDG